MGHWLYISALKHATLKFGMFVLFRAYTQFMNISMLEWFCDDDDDFCYKRVQTPGMSPPRAGAWTYCLFTP